jgi:hypothetical protein
LDSLAGFRAIGTLNAKATAANHYLRLDVKDSTITVKAIGADGSTIDTFTR